MFWISSALAQSVYPISGPVDLQYFRPSITAQHTLWTQDATRLPHKWWTVGLSTHFARDPLVWFSERQGRTVLVRNALTSDLHGGAQLGPLFVGAHVPFVLRSEGGSGGYGGETGLGDVSLELKGTLVDREKAPLGVAVAGQFLVPTSTTEAQNGSGTVRFEGEGIVDRAVGPALITANLGFQYHPTRYLGSYAYKSRVYARVGAGVEFSDRVDGSVEVVGSYNLGGFAKGAGMPVEALAGLGFRVLPPLELRVGGGAALSTGIGTPLMRGLMGVHYSPRLKRDADKDGVTDDLDRCPSQPEDVDGVEDADGCPEATRVTVRVEDEQGKIIGIADWKLVGQEPAEGKAGDAIERFPGAYELEASARGYAPNQTRVKIRDGVPQDVVVTLEKIILPGRVKVSITDEAGGPLQDAKWWFVGEEEAHLASGSEVERVPGSYEVRVESANFRPQTLPFTLKEDGQQTIAVRLQLARVVLVGERIEIKDSIYFETGRSRIKEESFPLLDEVVQVLQEHQDLKRIRIEGHTDSRGSGFNNLDLSQSRADAVAVYLSENGVDRARLDPIGFGEERPLVPGNDEAAWAKNRRVDFFVVERE